MFNNDKNFMIPVSLEQMKARLQECTKRCSDCDMVCFQTLMLCLRLSSEKDGSTHLLLLSNVVESFEIRTHFTMQRSELYGKICSVCAKEAKEAFEIAKELVKTPIAEQSIN